MFKNFTVVSVFLVITACQTNQSSQQQQKSYLEQRSDSAWAGIDDVLSKIHPPEIPDQLFTVTDFGAVPDDNVNDKPAFDSCIALCSQKGGVISVPSGRYIIKGPLHLKSNIHLQFDSGVYLDFSKQPEDYLPVVLTSWEGTRLYNYSPLIYANGQKNIAITGKAILDGNAAETWVAWQPEQREDQLLSRKMNQETTPLEERVFGAGHKLRTHFMQFYECENVMVEDVTIIDSPFWCLHPVYCKNVIIRNVVFDAQNLNNDGVDPESSEYVLIEDITFSNKDDNVAIKSGRNYEARELSRPSRFIIVRNCKFQGHNALAIGSEMSGGVNNVFVENCSFAGPVVKGIYLKSNKDRGSAIHNVFVRNVEFGKTSTTVEIDSDYKNEGEGFPPRFYNVIVENVTAKEATDYGIYIKGSEEEPVHDVLLKDIKIQQANNNLLIENAHNVFFENVKVAETELEPMN